jgi:hypothetical protein
LRKILLSGVTDALADVGATRTVRITTFGALTPGAPGCGRYANGRGCLRRSIDCMTTRISISIIPLFLKEIEKRYYPLNLCLERTSCTQLNKGSR